MLSLRTFASIAILLASAYGAEGQDVHHHEGATARVDEFYSTWLRPNKSGRMTSCCNKTDCYAANVRRNADGKLEVRIRETGEYVPIPAELREDNQDDPRESPDSDNHVCASPTGYLYCIVLGSGQ